MTNDHTSLEKYTSYTLFKMVAKGLCVRGELETEQNCNILTPSSFIFSSTSFSFCWAAQSGVLRAHSTQLSAGSLNSILSPTYWLQLTELPVAPGYIIVWLPPASRERRILHPIQPVHGQGYILMSSTGCTCFSIDGGAEGQYVTKRQVSHLTGQYKLLGGILIFNWQVVLR